MTGRGAFVGSSDANAPLITAYYFELLDILEPHLTGRKYLFGARPSFGDFGLAPSAVRGLDRPDLRRSHPGARPGRARLVPPHAGAAQRRRLRDLGEPSSRRWRRYWPTSAATFLPWTQGQRPRAGRRRGGVQRRTCPAAPTSSRRRSTTPSRSRRSRPSSPRSPTTASSAAILAASGCDLAG